MPREEDNAEEEEEADENEEGVEKEEYQSKSKGCLSVALPGVLAQQEAFLDMEVDEGEPHGKREAAAAELTAALEGAVASVKSRGRNHWLAIQQGAAMAASTDKAAAKENKKKTGLDHVAAAEGDRGGGGGGGGGDVEGKAAQGGAGAASAEARSYGKKPQKEQRTVRMVLEEGGWILKRRKRHYVFERRVTGGVRQTYTQAATPSDHSSARNHLTQLRRLDEEAGRKQEEEEEDGREKMDCLEDAEAGEQLVVRSVPAAQVRKKKKKVKLGWA